MPLLDTDEGDGGLVLDILAQSPASFPHGSHFESENFNKLRLRDSVTEHDDPLWFLVARLAVKLFQ